MVGLLSAHTHPSFTSSKIYNERTKGLGWHHLRTLGHVKTLSPVNEK